MRLENRAPAEGINSSTENPLKELAWLLAGSIAAVVAIVVALSLAAQWIAPRIPYEYEARLAASLPPFATAPETESGRAVQSELQSLADRLARHMQMPEGMKVRIGWSDSRTVNAYATLGGQVVFFGGLLARIESENALAMVMAHEIAHLKHRHAAAALGRGVSVGVMLSVISAELGRTAAGAMVNQAGVATLLKFSRDQERTADEAALQALAAEYGHVGGAIEMFDALLRLPGGQRASDTGVEFLRTHPLTENRRQAIADWAAANGVAPDGPRRPLPPAIAALRETKRDARS